MNSVIEKLSKIGIVPVVVIDDAKDAVPLAKALIEGGLPCAEVTFRTSAAADSIKAMREAYPDMVVGAGTVLTKEEADKAKEAGAKFLVSPGLNPDIVRYAKELGLPMVPGTCTPGDVERALSLGLTDIKFFPAEASGGLPFIKALCGPYTTVRFMPTGGLNKDNVRDYLAYPKIWACGGSWIAPKDLIASGNFKEIERRAKEAADIVRDVRGGKKEGAAI